MKYGKGVFAGAVTAILGAKTIATVAAQEVTDIASAGNGGVATASGNGGAVSAGDINSGGNVGSAIAVGDTYADPVVYGGDILNQTGLAVEVDGGTARADATGGNNNHAFVS
ncbi:MAG: hypothetical protein KY456_14165 [Chloroflexi bacterium]|nr:hypothetical protein [Chloroflexota bacterium]